MSTKTQVRGGAPHWSTPGSVGTLYLVRTPATAATAPGHGQNRARYLTMEHATERWLPVVGWEGKYEVSSHGRVRSVDRWIQYRDGRKSRWFPGRELAQSALIWGHLQVKLSAHGQLYNRAVHRLVAEAFIGPRPSPELEVRHLNGNPTDNRPENLRYGTKKENAQDSIRHGTNKELKKTRCKWGHEFDLIDSRGNRGCSQCRVNYRRERFKNPQERINKSRLSRRAVERRATAEGRTLRKRRSTALWHEEDK